MLLPRSKRPLCYLVIIVILFVIFRRFSEPESILEDDDDMLDSPHSNRLHQLTVVDIQSDVDWDPELVPERKLHSAKKPLPPALGKHKFRSDGLLQVNMEGAHPIFELISLAEKEWEAKLRGASKTFREAVQEYRRRYKRAPPKGFDLW